MTYYLYTDTQRWSTKVMSNNNISLSDLPTNIQLYDVPEWVMEASKIVGGDYVDPEGYEEARDFFKDKFVIYPEEENDYIFKYGLNKDRDSSIYYKKKSTKKIPYNQTVMYSKRQGYKLTMTNALLIATSMNEYINLLQKDGMSMATANNYFEKFGLRDIKLEKFKRWKDEHILKTYYTTAECDYCGMEFSERKSRIKNKKHIHCSAICHHENRSHITNVILTERFAQNEMDWETAKQLKTEEYGKYRGAVDSWSAFNFRTQKPDQHKIWKDKLNNLQLDHKFPVIWGFWIGTPIELMANIDNLRLIPQPDNGSKSGKLIMELVPDILKEEANKPPNLDRQRRLKYNKPPRQRAKKYMPDATCQFGLCNKKYNKSRSKAITPDKYCTINCEKSIEAVKQLEEFEIWIRRSENINPIYTKLKDKIVSMDWNKSTDIYTDVISEYEGLLWNKFGKVYRGTKDYNKAIIKQTFTDIWVGEYDLPTTGSINIDMEKLLMELNEDYSFPETYRGPYKLKCKECGTVEESVWRIQLYRWYGLDSDNHKDLPEVCQSCSMKRFRGIARGGWDTRK